MDIYIRMISRSDSESCDYCRCVLQMCFYKTVKFLECVKLMSLISNQQQFWIWNKLGLCTKDLEGRSTDIEYRFMIFTGTERPEEKLSASYNLLCIK